MTLVPDVHKIAVLNAKALGEFTAFMLPAIQSVRDAYPQAEVVLVAKPWHKAFFDGRPGPIDRTIAMPSMFGLMLQGEVPVPDAEADAFFAQMQAEHFDLAFQIHGPGEHGNPATARLGARLSFGTHGRTTKRLERSILYLATRNEVSRWLDVVAQAGVPATHWEPDIALTPEDKALADAALPTGDRLVAINPGASLRSYRWSPGSFAHIAKQLADRGFHVALVGPAQDGLLAAQVQLALKQPAYDLTGKLSDRALAGVLARCNLVVGNESDALRLAVALRVPTVGLAWAGTLANFEPLRHTHHRRAISWHTQCPVCGSNVARGRCEHEEALFAEITEEEVLRYALELLEIPTQG